MTMIIKENLITLSGAELYSLPTASHPEGGAMYRAAKRIKDQNDQCRKKNLRLMSRDDERAIFAGEVGELAACRYLERHGYQVQQLSWTEFCLQKGNESVVDLIASGPNKPTLSIQVKTSEYGVRTITPENVIRYQHGVSRIMFVAVREVFKRNSRGNKRSPLFECYVMSIVSPDQIPRLKSWVNQSRHFGHVDNTEFRKEWTSGRLHRMDKRKFEIEHLGTHNFV